MDFFVFVFWKWLLYTCKFHPMSARWFGGVGNIVTQNQFQYLRLCPDAKYIFQNKCLHGLGAIPWYTFYQTKFVVHLKPCTLHRGLQSTHWLLERSSSWHPGAPAASNKLQPRAREDGVLFNTCVARMLQVLGNMLRCSPGPACLVAAGNEHAQYEESAAPPGGGCSWSAAH